MIKAIHFQIQPLKCLLKNHKTMKKIIYLLIIVILSSNCKKEPIPDNVEYNSDLALYSNYYSLTQIDAEVMKKDTTGLLTNVVSDTVSYDSLCIQVNLLGEMITENTFYSNVDDCSTPYCSLPQEQKYFVDKISDIQVITDKSYSDTDNSIYNFRVYFRDKNKYYYQKSYYDESIAYSPLHIYLTAPPDSSQWFTFTVKITDDKGNTFSNSTVKVFVEKS